MELSFVTAALRRRWWIVLVFALIGLLPLLAGGGAVSSTYESTAQLELIAADDEQFNDPDRYVLNEIEVLNSAAIAEAVAAELPRDAGEEVEVAAGKVRRSTVIEQTPETDVVTVTVQQDDRFSAQLIAQTIVDVYMERLQAEEAAVRGPALAAYEADLSELQLILDDANNQIQTQLDVFIERVGEPNVNVPAAESLMPAAVSQRDIVSAEIQRITQLRNDLAAAPSGINSKVVQSATLPVNPVADGGNLISIAFFVGMALLGVTIALLWARFSTKVLDEVAVEEIVGAPVTASLRQSKTLKREPLVALTRMPQEIIAAVDQIAVQAEAKAKINQSLRVAVVGSQRGAGTTTLALALAARYAAADYSVLLVDADRRDPWITEVFGADQHGGVPALLGMVDERADRIFTRTSEQEVRVLGLGKQGAALRREQVPSLITAASAAANIIIFDGGPLLDAASTVELAKEVDAVVLAVPERQQRSDDLAAIARQLKSVSDKVLTVLTYPVAADAHRFGASEDGAGPGQPGTATVVPPSVVPPSPPTRTTSPEQLVAQLEGQSTATVRTDGHRRPAKSQEKQ